MLLSNIQKIKFFVVPIILGAIVLGFACSGIISRASMRNAGTDLISLMAPADNQECCDTGISKHIELWKSILSADPREMQGGLFLFMLGLVITFIIGRLRFPFNFIDYYLLSYKLRIRGNPNPVLFDYLKFLFARGILNPKIY